MRSVRYRVKTGPDYRIWTLTNRLADTVPDSTRKTMGAFKTELATLNNLARVILRQIQGGLAATGDRDGR
jgi:hypothetical protein